MRYLSVLVIALGLFAGCNRSQDTSGSGASTVERGVVLLRYAIGSESTEQREKGFVDTWKKEFPEIPIISDEVYAGATRQTALEASQNLLNKYGDRMDGVFAVNESSAAGLLEAMEQHGLAGKVKFVGFDTSNSMIQAMEEGKMHGMVLQDPVRMAYTAVITMVKHLDGEPVEKRISTGELMATPENMEDPKVAARLSPKQFSGNEANPENPKYRIAVIPKGTTHDFWRSVHEGAEQAARELGNVKIFWQGPLQEDHTDDQIKVVEGFVTKEVDGICLAPLDSGALVDKVKYAHDAGIPVVIYDSGLDDESLIVSYVATDNYNGGVLAARRLGELLRAEKKP